MLKSILVGALILGVAPLTYGASVSGSGSGEQRYGVDGVDLRVDLGDAFFPVGADALMAWVQRSTAIVSGYYGRFPTSTLRIRIEPQPGEGVRGGQTFGYRGGFIRVQVGRAVTAEQLRNDWVLVHEMTHLALPDVGKEHSWLAEGLAVYIEGIEREQAGNRTEQDVFAEQIRQMPKGLPQSGDRGLDHTHTWARIYWGGAMFCFLADVEIHRQTGNRMGLQDAMRAVAAASGGMASDWPITKVFATADAATGTTAMSTLYAQMRDSPVTPDLRLLWAKLGVEPDGNSVTFDDHAPMAAIRRAIMQPRGNRT